MTKDIRIDEAQDQKWPKIHEPWTLDEVVEFCDSKGQGELAEYVRSDPPDLPFKTDGCSVWVDRWFGLDLYPYCLVHDIWYWAGKTDDERVMRRKADDQLLNAVKSKGRPLGAALMWFGVRIGGGSWIKNPSFSWGFGRSSMVKS